LPFLIPLILLGWHVSLNAQVINIDKQDYAPGETVQITGTGWQPGESVTLDVEHLSQPIPDYGTTNPYLPWTVTADASGEFSTIWYVNDFEVGATLLLTADGPASGMTLEIIFTDATQTQIINLGPTSGDCGSTINVTAQLQYKGSKEWFNFSNQTISFTLGSATATGTTNGNGVATVSLRVPSDATNLVANFATVSGYSKSNATIPFTVTSTLGTVGSISGPAIVCAGTNAVSYSVPVVLNASGYTWSVPSDATIASGNGTNSIVVNFGTSSGTISVAPVNNCGTGTASSLSVTVEPIPTATIAVVGSNPVIYGSTTFIKFTGPKNGTVTYNINGGANITHDLGGGGNWTLTTDALTQNTTYNLVSVSNDACSASVSGSVTVVVNSPLTFTSCPSNITQSNDKGLCSAVVNYTAVATGTPAPTYTYAFTGATIATGNGTGSGAAFNAGTTHVTVTATNTGSTVTCSFDVTVTDTEVPALTAPPTITLTNDHGACGAKVADLGTPEATDNCGLQPLVNDHASDFYSVETTTVTWTATDIHGNIQTATQQVMVSDNEAPVITTNGDKNVNTGDGVCGAYVEVTATATDNCTVDGNPVGVRNDGLPLDALYPVGTTKITWTVNDIHGNGATAEQIITVSDNTPPLAKAQDVTVYLNDGGKGSLTAQQVDNGSSDACGIANLSLSKTDFSCEDIATNPNEVILTVTDNHGNISTAKANVTVLDKVAPVVKTKDISVQLDASGVASILPADVDNGSTDNCDIADKTLDVSSFTCANVGSPVTVTLTVTDIHSNSASKTALVTVEDNVAPVVKTKDITVQLDASGKATIMPADVDDGSTDNCDIADKTLDVSSFSCANVGSPVTVTLTVTDIHNNSASKTAVVTVEDKVAPVVKTKDITVQLDASGVASILPADVDNGSTDNCDIADKTLDVSSFSCANVGSPVTVTLTVTDIHNNSASKTAVVTVEDKIAPVVKTKDITVQLDASGVASILPADVDNGSTDNCGIADKTLDISGFTCANVGSPVTVTLTVTDIHGNSAANTAVVTVEDNVAPVVKTKDITVQLDASGKATIMPADVDDGSTDNCDIADKTLDVSSFTCANVGSPVTVTLTVTDIHGNSAANTAVVTVEDKVAPVINCKVGTSRYLDAYQTFYTVSGTEFDATATDACGIASITYGLSGATMGSGTSLAGVHLNCGTNTITWTATDTHGNASVCTTVVTVNKRPTTVTYNGDLTIQYSDKISLSAMLTDNVSGNGIMGRTVTFAIGSQTTSAVTDASGVAATTLILTQAPGNYTVNTSFAGDGSYLSGSDADPFTISAEDAIAVYSGLTYFSTPSSTNYTATIQLMATISDIDDGLRGDIRNARITFHKDAINGAILGTAGLAPALVNAADPTVGTVSTICTYTLNASEQANNGTSFNVYAVVDNYYTASSDPATITVGIPGTDAVTGGGYLKVINSAGTYQANGSKTNFGFTMKYNKTGKNIKGQCNIIMRSGGRIYQIKSNAINSMSVNSTTGYANFNTKANLTDVTNSLAPVSLGGNLDLTVEMTDVSQGGTGDLVDIQLMNGNAMLYSSNWSGTKTVLQAIDGGNIQVLRNALKTLEVQPETIEAVAQEQSVQVITNSIVVYPTPSYGKVTFKFSVKEDAKVTLDIINLNGMLIDRIFENHMDAGSTMTLDYEKALPVGTYLYRMVVNGEVQTGKLVIIK
jgi:hypothetical protein